MTLRDASGVSLCISLRWNDLIWFKNDNFTLFFVFWAPFPSLYPHSGSISSITVILGPELDFYTRWDPAGLIEGAIRRLLEVEET